MVAGEEAAYRAYLRGKRAFEAGDYDAALLAFGDGLRQLPDERPYVRSRGALALWVVRSHGLLYALRGDVTALDRETALLHAYADRLDDIARDPEDRATKQALVDRRLQQIADEKARISTEQGSADEQLDRSLRGEYEGIDASTWQPRSEDLAWVRRPDDPRPRARQVQDDEDPHRAELDDDAQAGSVRRPGSGLIAGGAASLSLGVAAFVVMGVGMAQARAADDFSPTQTPEDRRAQIGRGLAGNAMAVTGVVTGSVAVIIGAVLIGLGVKKRRAAIAPEVGPRSAGVSLTVRFAP